jgi:hypothetical protein
MDLASKNPTGGPNCDAQHDATDIFHGHFAHLLVRSSLTVSGNARRSAGRHRQRPDPPEHRPEQPPRQVTLRQQEPVVAGVLDKPAHPS